MGKSEIKNYFISRLKSAGILNYEQEFVWLACHTLKINSAGLITANDELFINNYELLNEIITRRENGEPLQYIIGEAAFYGRDFITGADVLIPRQDTESLIDAVLYLFNDKNHKFKFLDWGTGTGCIAITILIERPEAFAVMLDKSPEALDYAKKNIKKYNLEGRAELLFNSELPNDFNFNKKFDFIISNPPYIPTRQINNLMREVRDYEPYMALEGGIDGMDYYKMLFQCAPLWLKPDGFLILEIGDGEQAKILNNFNNKNLKFIKSFPDSSGFERCMVWQL